MSQEKPIYVVSKSDTVEVKELVDAAKRLKIPLRVVRAENINEAEDIAENSSIVYWRSGSIGDKFDSRIGRTTMLSRIKRSVPVINHSTAPVADQVYKSVQQEIFLKNKNAAKSVESIETFLAPDRETLIDLIESDKLTYPFIAKPNFGRCGIGIELIEKEEDFKKLGELNTYVFQNFIRNRGDYRILVIGGVAHMVFKRVSTGHYLNNLSQGGKRESVDDPVLHNKLAKAGSIIAAMFGYTICGVDIIEGEDGTLYFMEVNSVPQWFGWQETTNYPVADHILNTLAAIARPKNEKTIFADVENYYRDNLQYLSAGTRFHFLSRLHLWSLKKKYANEIKAAREEWWATFPDVVRRLAGKDVKIELAPSKKYRKAAALAHPLVDQYNAFFFKCIFDRTIFKGTAFEDNYDDINPSRLQEVRLNLLKDSKSLFILSTVAINFLYHYEHFLGNTDGLFDPIKLLAIPDKHSLPDEKDDRDARIYYYTHMIIGASNFYSKKISKKDSAVYVDALKRVEQIISENYNKCTIDQKAEFMVCARLCGYASHLEEIIRSELATSCSPHGNFLVNTQNIHRGSVLKEAMETAEHSNVLAIMAFAD